METGESSYPEIVEDKGIGMKKIVAATLGLILLFCAAAFIFQFILIRTAQISLFSVQKIDSAEFTAFYILIYAFHL